MKVLINFPVIMKLPKGRYAFLSDNIRFWKYLEEERKIPYKSWKLLILHTAWTLKANLWIYLNLNQNLKVTKCCIGLNIFFLFHNLKYSLISPKNKYFIFCKGWGKVVGQIYRCLTDYGAKCVKQYIYIHIYISLFLILNISN